LAYDVTPKIQFRKEISLRAVTKSEKGTGHNHMLIGGHSHITNPQVRDPFRPKSDLMVFACRKGV